MSTGRRREAKAPSERHSRRQARYTRVKFAFDSEIDHIRDLFDWVPAVCERHRDACRRRQDGAQRGIRTPPAPGVREHPAPGAALLALPDSPV